MIKSYIKESIDLNKKMLADSEIILTIEKMITVINNCLKKGGKILIAGNGGSAADAQHFAAEIVGRYKRERNGYPAISLTTDSSILTAISNDYGFDLVFARQIEAISNPGDIFFGISTSGNSLNIIKGISEAKKRGLNTLCLLGRDGGKIKKLADLSFIVPSDNTPRIQEIHAMIIHIICEEIEKNFV